MRFVYFAIKFMPVWTIPLGLIFFEAGMVFRRRENHRLKKRMWMVATFWALATLAFFIFDWGNTLFPILQEEFGLEGDFQSLSSDP